MYELKDITGAYCFHVSQLARLTFTSPRLGTIFYLSYLLFEFPQNLCLQRFPVAKWMR